jgi:hypothetical protein
MGEGMEEGSSRAIKVAEGGQADKNGEQRGMRAGGDNRGRQSARARTNKKGRKSAVLSTGEVHLILIRSTASDRPCPPPLFFSRRSGSGLGMGDVGTKGEEAERIRPPPVSLHGFARRCCCCACPHGLVSSGLPAVPTSPVRWSPRGGSPRLCCIPCSS